jgi:hypothetical protein
MYTGNLFHLHDLAIWVTRIKRKYPIPIADHGEKMARDSERKKMYAMRGSKDLYSRILGGIGKGSEGQTQLQYF